MASSPREVAEAWLLVSREVAPYPGYRVCRRNDEHAEKLVVAGRRASTLHTFGIVTNNITCKLRHQHSSDSSLISTELKGDSSVGRKLERQRVHLARKI